MSDHEHDGMLTAQTRTAWLEIGGFVAGADGLSEQEIQELAGSAAGPDLDGAACIAAIQKGAGYESLPEATTGQVRDSDIFVRVQCLMEIYNAAQSDGLSAPESARLQAVVGTMLGSDKVSNFMRLCDIQAEANQLFSSLVMDS